MKILNLKQLFISDYRYNWEDQDFIKKGLDYLAETKTHTFYETSPSRGKKYEDQLSEFVKQDK